jgi:hypothetical protein
MKLDRKGVIHVQHRNLSKLVDPQPAPPSLEIHSTEDKFTIYSIYSERMEGSRSCCTLEVFIAVRCEYSAFASHYTLVAGEEVGLQRIAWVLERKYTDTHCQGVSQVNQGTKMFWLYTFRSVSLEEEAARRYRICWIERLGPLGQGSDESETLKEGDRELICFKILDVITHG